MAESKTAKNSWLEVFKSNYDGKSPEAKSVQDCIKSNYKGNSYIPWATMERLTYMQDPDAEFIKVPNLEHGGLVHTATCEIAQEVIADGVIKNATKTKAYAHFVKVQLTFLGKTFIEEYPIQDSSYEAVKAYDSNLVNKALQRALAKVASRATGIGLRLYEQKDLQFNDVTETKPEIKPIVKKEKVGVKVEKIEPTETDKAEEIIVNSESEVVVKEESTNIAQIANEMLEEKASSDAEELANLILTTDKYKMIQVLQRLNTAIITKFGFSLSVDDTKEELIEKISKFQDVSKFINAVKVQLNSL